MDSSDTSKLCQANSENFSRQNQDNTEWKITILENRELLMARLQSFQTNVKDPCNIADVASCYGICNVPLTVGIPRWGTDSQRFREGNFRLVSTLGLILIASTRDWYWVVKGETYVEQEADR